ncbi:response regulator [Gemmata sp. JC717]|uniref:ATP-binding response regulator n=1 Tax=Gemmata algarum TaxID=2975278 RepID=UPI0021BA6921|nr:hybrid sensor histidine kinase/response regulator [Gemmata algarum]MDY3553448.1 response regulator [Gemmata algarum]
MKSPLRVLLVEDNPDDEVLVARELRRGGLSVATERVETRSAYAAALGRGGWDVIIADYALPAFSGLEALELLQARGDGVPFLLVSGTVGEQIAVESLHAGADDYLLKQNLIRLVPAVTRAIREATERRRRRAAERALEENRARLSLIHDSVSDLLLLLVPGAQGEWRYASANRALVRTLAGCGVEVAPDQLVGREAGDVEANLFRFDAATAEWFAGLRARALAAGAPVAAEREIRLPGGAFVGEFTFIPTGGGGAGAHLLIDGRDVTAQRRAEERDARARDQMIRSQRLEALGTLAGGIAHDFNNLLAGIFGFAELAQTADDLGAAREHCAQLVRVAARARELVGQVLAFARPQPDGREPVSLCAVVRELLPLMRASFSKGIAIEVRLAEAGAMVSADGGQLHQAVLNLCTNAAQAMPRGGRLSVWVEVVHLADPVPADLCPLSPGPHAKLTVSDTGTGMTQDTLRRAFEPFFTTKPVGQGTGLGLSVVHGIVRAHHGAIRVNTEPGAGTTFEVYLPVVPSGATPPEPVAAAPGRGERVLVVDDDPALADMTAQMLVHLGYASSTFTDPIEAGAAFAADPAAFAAVLTDDRMPGRSGVELARGLVEYRPDLPVVLTVAAPDRDALATFRRAVRAGSVLPKPFTRDQLAEALDRAVRRER